MTSSTSSSSSHRWKYDVFLSFRGEDTRKGFVSHLYHELQYWYAIRTFKDDRDIEIGETISPQLLRAIEESHIAVVVLSPNYASSTWCLDELAQIVDSKCCKNTILPVFFNVDPCDVRHQGNSFDKAFAEHDKGIKDMEKVERWRDALRKVASISGVCSKDYVSERDVMKPIVEFVLSKVLPLITLSNSNDKLVGVDQALDAMSGLLDLEVKDVRFIGIWGMGGVGKTTLANLVFQRISDQFEVTKFLFKVGEVSAKHNSVLGLQKQLVYPILRDATQIFDEQQGAAYIEKCLLNKKVLLVIDSVDHYKQLEMLIGDKSWFGVGSRIIVTTRDERLLIEHDIKLSYKVEVLDDQKALELFSQNAFREDHPKHDFFQLSKDFVDYAKGLPLALKIVGRSLYKRDLDAWKSELNKLKMIPNPTIFDSLKMSYDVLDDMQKTIFLDIAHFYKGMEKGLVIEALESCGLCGCIGLDVLIEKSLIDLGHSNYVGMHDLIQEMAVEIVRRECIEDPGRRSRLCNKDDVFGVLKNNTGTKAVRGIRLCLPSLEEGDMDWNIEGLTKMSKLVFLEFYNLRFRSAPQFLPGSLRTLKWSLYPSKYLPASFRPKLLVELTMVNSKIVQLWHGKQDFPSLKYMNLMGSRNLIKTPDFTGIPNLEKLELAFCWNLCEIHPSLTVHKKLKRLNLLHCKNIKRFPTVIDMESLETFWFRESTKACIPDIARGMKSLLSLDLGCSIFEKRSSSLKIGFWNLFTKKSLVPQGSLYPSLRELRFLKKLRLDGCNLWEGALPDDIGYCMPNLEWLHLSGNNFVTLPSSIKCMSKLVWIELNHCKSLQQLMDLPPIAQLEVQVNNCPSLKMFSKQLRMCLDCRTHDKISMLHLTSVNCFGLIDDEGWNKELFLMVEQLTAQLPSLSRIIPDFGMFSIISPGSKIPAWFDMQSEGDTLTVELPAHQVSCRPKCIGIWFCVVFANPEPSVDPEYYALEVAACKEKFYFSRIVECNVRGDHMWIVYKSGLENEETTNSSVSFKTELLSRIIGLLDTPCLNSVKRCAARLMFEEDMNELLNETVNISKRSREYCEVEETQEIRRETDSPNKQSLFKRLKA